uniref:tRNA (N(6)-L-threonylcarbamoyladenosine(37)-C(2))-methylthiotransferase MtaB n=1 Tax=Fervidobacterium thailandense TaxID=1008305 RepID=A0A7C5VKT6_9BACT
MTRIAVITQGCKLNQYESELIVELLENAGYVVLTVDDPSVSAYVINTCAVTAEAERKVRQTVRHLKKINPNAKLILTGCYAQVKRPQEEYTALGVDLVLGNLEKKRILSFLQENGIYASQNYWVEDDISYEIINNSVLERSRAFVKVEDGCNNGCTYCVIRSLRGTKIRSKPIEVAITEIEKLVQKKHREIVLTGLNLGKYGRDINVSLTDLLSEIVKIKGEFRIRLSSINPEDVTDELIELINNTDKICNHLHIPIQSGSDAVLRRMGRNYSTHDLMRLFEKLRKLDENFSISTDIIVGFPGESNEDFEETLKLVSEVEFSRVHTFRYSQRPNTRAAEFENQIPGNIRKERAEILIKLSKKVAERYRTKLVGKQVTVLVEGTQNGVYFGYDEYYNQHETSEGVIGDFLRVRICSVTEEGVLSKNVQKQASNG